MTCLTRTSCCVTGPEVSTCHRKTNGSSFSKMYRGFLFLWFAFSFVFAFIHSEVCLFSRPRPARVQEWGGGGKYQRDLKGAVRVAVTSRPVSQTWRWKQPPPSVPERFQVIQRPWRARRRRRCRCSTWWGGTPRRGSTPRTSCGGR